MTSTPSTSFLAHMRGFTPLIDILVQELGLMPALTFGVVWRHCQMRDGVCRAKLDTLADMIGVSRKTIQRCIRQLVEAGYLEDTTPNRVNAPHVYRDTGKARIVGTIAAAESGGDGPSPALYKRGRERLASLIGEDSPLGLSDQAMNCLDSLTGHARTDSPGGLDSLTEEDTILDQLGEGEDTPPETPEDLDILFPESAGGGWRQSAPSWMAESPAGEWREWGNKSDEAHKFLEAHPNEADRLRVLGYKLQEDYGLYPDDWKDRTGVKSWMTGLLKALAAGGGSVAIALEAAKSLRDDGLTVSSPFSLVNTARALRAEHEAPTKAEAMEVYQ